MSLYILRMYLTNLIIRVYFFNSSLKTKFLPFVQTPSTTKLEEEQLFHPTYRYYRIYFINFDFFFACYTHLNTACLLTVLFEQKRTQSVNVFFLYHL